MSWAPASFLLLALALAVGFAWYERSHPSPRLLAVVGTLAALAVLGRIAFAPVPNVKPTTDIVLIAGYALGGAPGFAVGAVTGLVSNFFFAQGPWTPWQMGAWGLVGVLGALLAWGSGRRMGRVPLALACGAAGLAHGAIMDFSTWVTYTGGGTSGQYLAIAGTSLPFNLAHAAGNVAFFLAFGPGLVRAVERCRVRFEITWRPALPAALAVVAAVGAVAAAAAPARAAEPAIERAADYLEAARNADGGWGAAPKAGSNALYGAWAAIGLAASERPPSEATVGHLRTGAVRARIAADLERSILALTAAGSLPRDVRGRDLVAALRARQRDDGSFEGMVNVTSFGVLALKAAGREAGVAAAARWIERQQNADGGLSFDRRGGPSGVDDTAGAVQAVVAARGREGRFVERAVRFLRGTQGRDGGFPLTPGGPTNAQSTAFAVQALVAAEVDPATVRRGGPDPLTYLRALQAPDGSLRYSRSSAQTPVWVTGQALAALARRPLPVLPPGVVPAEDDRRGVAEPEIRPAPPSRAEAAGALLAAVAALLGL